MRLKFYSLKKLKNSGIFLLMMIWRLTSIWLLDASRLDGAERSSKPEDDDLTVFVEITLVRRLRRIFVTYLNSS